MLKAIQEKAGDDPVVITGDFNANMNEPLGHFHSHVPCRSMVRKKMETLFTLRQVGSNEERHSRHIEREIIETQHGP